LAKIRRQGNPWLRVLPFLVFLLMGPSRAFTQEGMPFEVVVKGLEGDALKNVELALTPPEGMIKENEVDELLLALFEKQAPQKVREALEPFGYYQAQIQTSMERPPGRIQLFVRIDPGEPVRISSITIDLKGPGAQDEKLRKGLPEFPLKKGDILRQDRYDEVKNTFREKALEAGYIEADFSVHLIRLSLKENTAQIELILSTGPRFYFGEITFVPPLTYPETFLRRYLAFRTGRVFSAKKLAETQLNFINSDRFRAVSVEAHPEEARDHHIPVLVRLTPSKPKRFKMGVGYETDNGAGVLVRYQDLNFAGQGHEFNTELRLSEGLQGLAADYILPGSGNPDNKTTLKAGFKREITDTYDSRSIFSQYEYQHSFGRGRLVAGYLQLFQEDYSIVSQQGLSTMLMPGARFWHRHYDNLVRPTKGYRYSLETRGSAPFLGSDGSFLQFLLQGDSMTPLGKGFSLLLRGHGGTTWQNKPLVNLPPTIRFFAGGDQSIRGYGYQSLGPTDASGKVIGGRQLMVGSLEIEKAFSPVWGLAAFYDAGNAFDDFSQFELKQGAGLGVRFYTPVGPIRVDLARQIGESSPQYRFHFSIGFGL
jgi:translocation and assembly module TamA